MNAVIFTVLLLMPALLQAQTTEAPSSPGDNFSLQGALDLFSRSKDLEAFEKALNDPDQHINNLDLDNDGQVDYLRVVDHKEGDVHAIILQAPINGSESQDVAVIEVEKTGVNTAQARIVGDENLYGPGISYEKYTSVQEAPSTVVVDVWGWPSVRYIYGPSYRVWASPWYWGHYPGWYSPWHPYPVHVYYGYTTRYHPYYKPARINVYHRADVVYVSHRRSSPTVVQQVRPTHVEPRSQENVATPPAGDQTGKTNERIAPAQDASPKVNEQPPTKREARSKRRATRRAKRHGDK